MVQGCNVCGLEGNNWLQGGFKFVGRRKWFELWYQTDTECKRRLIGKEKKEKMGKRWGEEIRGRREYRDWGRKYQYFIYQSLFLLQQKGLLI